MKKKLPVFVLEKIQPLIEKAMGLADAIVDDKYSMYLVDNDEFDKSDFYFKVIYNKEKRDFSVVMNPRSELSLHVATYDAVTLEKIEEYLNKWLNVLQRYRNVKTVYDNPARYQTQYFYDEFKIVDDEADIAPFNPNQVMLIDEYIEKYKMNLSRLKQEDSKEAIDEIIKECEDLQSEIYSVPKNKVMKGFAKIWGKTVTTLKKEGKGFIKEAWEEFKKDIIGKLTPLLTGGVGAAIAEAVTKIL